MGCATRRYGRAQHRPLYATACLRPTRTAIKNAAGGKPPSEPESDRPVVELNNHGSLNGTADGYTAKANVGSRESSIHTVINVPRSVAKMVQEYDLGELWITPDI